MLSYFKNALKRLCSNFIPIRNDFPIAPEILIDQTIPSNHPADGVSNIITAEEPNQNGSIITEEDLDQEETIPNNISSIEEKISKAKQTLKNTIISDQVSPVIELVHFFKSQNMKIDFIIDDDGNNLLHLAVSIGRINLIKLLIKFGINPNNTNNFEQTPLHLAAILNYDDIIDELMDSDNLRVDIRDRNGKTPLHEALNHKSLESVNTLFATGRYIGIDVAGDGSCFFHAVVRQYGIKNIQYTAKELRQKAVNYILQNFHLFREFFAYDAQDNDGQIYSRSLFVNTHKNHNFSKNFYFG